MTISVRELMPNPSFRWILRMKPRKAGEFKPWASSLTLPIYAY
jgi:hypothetical protein